MYRYMTSQLAGIGGAIKENAGDFQVEEISAYEPCGSGEHLYLTIEKEGITTPEAIRRVARHFSINERDIGYAGLKDAVGITRQTISVQRVPAADAAGVNLERVRIISASRHTNKLKLGHLKGNRFSIMVRAVLPHASEVVPQVLAILRQRGVPNFFGFQRYGSQGNSHLIGEAMLRRDWKLAIDRLIGSPEAVRDEAWRNAIVAYHRGEIPRALELMPRHCRTEAEVLRKLATHPEAREKAFNVINPRLRKLYLSAFQSHLFDQMVEQRLDSIDRVMAGDLAWKHVNGACFLVDDPAAEAARAASFEISASGPMFGTRMKLPAGDPLVWELAVMQCAGIRMDDFDLGAGMRLEGERRPLRVPLLGEPEFQLNGSDLRLTFALPRGSYATSVLREICKNDTPQLL